MHVLNPENPHIYNVERVKVFQIGLESFGRHGFEKFIELHNYYKEIDVELAGVCDSDFEKLEMAEKFAETQDVNIETFKSTEKIYQAAEQANTEDCKILIYDAGPTELHAEHIYRSLRNNFFHLAEKPPSMTREDHLKEKKLMLDNNVRFTVDFIERESPVVKKTLKILEEKNIESIEIFRESTMGAQKLLQPVERIGVKGGAILDKMCHEAYIIDLIGTELEVKDIEKSYMPYSTDSDSFMTLKSGKSSSISENTAESQCHAKLEGDTEVIMHSSWLGCSARTKTLGAELENLTGHNPVNSEFQLINDQGLLDEESRFFIVKGEKDLFADMLNNKLFDMDTGEEVKTPNLIHDQLYRVLESSVRCAAGLENNALTEEELDQFMNLIFDISEYCENPDEFEALQSSNQKVNSLTVDNVFEAEGAKDKP